MSALADLEKDKFNAQGEIKVSGDFAVAGQTDYTASDIAALGSSTNINDWVSAFHDGQLTYKYVQEYNGTQEKVVYVTHPSLGDNNKCLRLFKIYSTQNNTLVLQGVKASVADWTFDSNVQGTVSITLGTVTSPAANATAGTDVCSVTIANTGSGTNTLSLSGTNASLYQLNNTTQGQTGSTLSNVATTDTVVIETASDFTNVTYSHSLTVTITESNFNLTASQNITTSGTEVVAAAYANEFSVTKASSGNSYDMTYLRFLSAAITNFDTKAFSYGFWFKSNTDYTGINVNSGGNTGSDIIVNCPENVNTIVAGYFVTVWGADIRIGRGQSTSNAYRFKIAGVNNSLFDGDWHHLLICHDGTTNQSNNITNFTANHDVYIDGVLQTKSGAANFGNVSQTNQFTSADIRLGKSISHSNFNSADSIFALGKVDEAAFWNNTKLTATEASLIYNNGKPTDLQDTPNVTVPTTYYRFENSSDLGLETISSSNAINTNLNHSSSQLTMDDPIYVSQSGNHKYISDTWRTFLTGSILVGNYYRDSSTDKKGFFPDLDSTTGFRSSNNVSYSFWAKFNSISGLAALWQEHYVLSATYQSYTSTYINGSNFFVFAAHNASRRDRYCTVPTDNNWHHVVVTTTTADIVSGAIFYIDGAAVSTTLNSYGGGSLSSTRTQPVDAINFGGTLYTRGSSSGTYSNSASGTLVMDEFSTWKKTLTASEVTELYNNGSPSDLTQHSAATDLQRWFRFGDTTGDGTAIKDSQDTSVELVSHDGQNNIQNH